jgi:DNA-binding FadR family transcriptional regulator
MRFVDMDEDPEFARLAAERATEEKLALLLAAPEE